MALTETKPASATLPVFERGNYQTTQSEVKEKSNPSSPPKPLLIVRPTEAGTYPVILFCHGTMLLNTFYSDLFHHIASHGFIVVAPQFYTYIIPSGTEEVAYAAAVANWLPTGLPSNLPQSIQPISQNEVTLIGHSRGGQTAFALALLYGPQVTNLSYTSIIGIDPVAGCSKCCQSTPGVLSTKTFENLAIPVTVIGTGLGGDMNYCVMVPCAPKCVNHEQFFKRCKAPCAHFVAKDYGHMDMLNDDPKGPLGLMSDCVCKNGKGPRDPMRRCVGGIVVAFWKAFFETGSDDFITIVRDPSVAPVKLDQPVFIAS